MLIGLVAIRLGHRKGPPGTYVEKAQRTSSEPIYAALLWPAMRAMSLLLPAK